MKIRTLLITSIVTFSILILIIAGLVVVTNQQIGTLVDQEVRANTIALEVGELGYLSNDFILYREPQQADRWNTKYVSISDDIAGLTVDQPEQKAIVRNLEANLRNTRSVFDEITSNPVQPDRTADSGFVQLSWSRMAVQNQGMVFDAGRLANLLNEESEELMRIRNLLIFVLMGVFIAFLFTSYLIFYRRALTSITALNKGIQEFGSGNLSYQLETGADDEIGDIAQGLNRMTVDLRQVTASKTDLEREVSERKRVEAQLVRNNEDLNALNEELTATQEELQQNLDELSKRETDLHSVALFPTENPSPTMRVNDQGILLFANPASTRVLGCWKAIVGEKVPDNIMRNALDSLKHGIMQETEEICESYTYSIKYAPISPQNYVNLYFADITRRKRAEDQLVRKNEDLNALNEELTAAQEELHQNIEELTRAEKMLRENEEKYRIIVETANEGIWITDAEKKTILVNQRMADMLGYPVKEVLGRTPSEFLGAGQEQIRLKTSDDLKKGQSTQREFKFRRKDGSDLWVISSASPVFDNKGNYLRTVSLLADITDRKVAEDAVKKSEEEYRHLVKYAPAAIYEISSDGNRFKHVNDAMCHILGYSQSELLKMNPFDILDEESKVRFQERVKKRLAGDDIDEMVAYRIFGRDGREKWVTLNVRLNREKSEGTLVVAHDVTERKRAEDALREAHRRTAAILESVADTFYSLDNEWRFITVNPAAEKAPFRRPAAELLGRVIWDLYPSLVGTRIHRRYLDAAANYSLEHYEAQSPLDGQWYEVFMQGRKGGVDVYMRDITGRKKAETALRESEERFRLALRNAPVSVAVQDRNLVYQWAFNQRTRQTDEIIGKTDADLFAPEDLGWIRELKCRVLESGSPIRVEKWLTSNSRRMYLDISYEPIRSTGGEITGIGMATVDLTDKKLVEEALQESEERFRLALRNAPVSVAIQDTDLVFQWAYNQRTIKPEDVKGKKDTDIFTQEDAARLIELKRQCLVTGNEIRDKCWLTMDGKRVFTDLYLEPLRDDRGKITGIGIAMVDLTEQKLIEDALRYSEENLLQAQELLDDVTRGTDVIIAVQDTNFRYIFFNQPYKEEIKRLTGKDLTIGSSMIDLFAKIPEEQKMSLDEWGKVLNGENVNQTIAFGPPGRNRRVYHVLHTPIRDAQGVIIAAGEVAFDITRQAQVEEALRETKEYLDNLITYANAPIIVWDPQFRITRFNRAFEHLTGRRAKEVLGKPLDILFPENHLVPATDLIRRTVEGERWDSVEIPVLNKKGEIRTVLWNSASIFGPDGYTLVSTIAQGQDITDRKILESETRLRAEGYAEMNVVLEDEIRHRKISDAALKNTLSLLHASLESTADGILVVDRQGKITSFNKNFMDMWNIPPEILESGNYRSAIDHILPQLKNPEGYITSLRELEVHPGRESFDMIVFNDGKIFERYSKPQKIGDSVVGRVWSFRDITDRKRAEESLVASLGEKEVLLREIHHRVKNNLQLISGLIDMTRMRTVDESTNSVLTDLMLKIQTMAQIHTRLYESKEFGKISLTGQIRDQVTALSNIYSHKGHEIICEIAGQEIFLPVDQAIPCALVINEILSNAYKHAFKGRKHGTIEITAQEEDGQVQITVRDDGIGIPAGFDISRTNSLGLKLVRTLVQFQLKGTLMFKSQNGTEFSIEFPVITVGT
jgi:PAS domain S-box-containing protein